MSKYLPYAAQVKEYNMQEKRRAYGLKVGTYVRWPDAEKGPYIVLANKFDELEQARIGEIVTQELEAQDSVLKKLED
jgi:hypothetical protein